MTVDQIENSMRSDTVWDRPSWPLKGNYQHVFDEFNKYTDDFINIDDSRTSDIFYKNKLYNETITNRRDIFSK